MPIYIVSIFSAGYHSTVHQQSFEQLYRQGARVLKHPRGDRDRVYHRWIYVLVKLFV